MDCGIDEDEIFLERPGLGDELAGGIQCKAGAIKDETVIASNLVDQQNRKTVLAGDAGQHRPAQLTLAHMERRGGNVEDKLAAGTHQFLDWIGAVETAAPEGFVIPCIFADGERHGLAVEEKRCCSGAGAKLRISSKTS